MLTLPKGKYDQSLNKWLGYFAFLMSFNYILIGGLNISIVLFAFLIFRLPNASQLLNIRFLIQFFALYFILGVIVSTLDVNTDENDSVARALSVLPNYVYWTIIIVGLTNLYDKINWSVLSKYIFWGLLCTLVFYTFRKIIILPFLKSNSPNAYAFILVCFSAIGVKYIDIRYNRTYAIIALVLLLLSLLVIERRAGFVLVALSSIGSLYLRKVKIQYLTTPIVVAFTITIALQLEFIENQLYNVSPRIHELIYENDDITSTDQSYLTRKLMIERGLVIFAEHPLTGIGMNNYAIHKVINTEGNFDGAELVLGKAEDIQFSAHNSYLFILVEGGLLVLIPILLIFGYNLYNFVIYYNRRTQVENAFYWAFAAVVLHLYFISEIVNVYVWFLIAAVSSLSVKYNKPIKS